MCGTFKQEVQQAISAGNEPSFQAQAQCPPNYDSAALLAGTSKNFWSDWLQMIRPSGNPFGAYMIASDKKLEAEGLAYTGRIFQLTADQGYRGTKETPGIIQSNAAQRASMMDLDYLLNSDDLEEYFGSVVDAFINRIINEGLQYMQTGTYAPQGKPPQFQPSQQTVDLDYVEINYETIIQISDLLALTEENLNILRTEQLRIATSTPPAPPAQTVAWLNWTDSAILAFEQLIIAAEQAIAAKATGDQALINQTIVSFKTSQTTAVNALMTLLNTREINLSKLSSKLDDFNSDIVDEINRIIILYRLYGN